MRTIVVMLALALGAAPAIAQEMYRWVDENGVVHYSDRPRDGAEKVELAPVQSYQSDAVSRPQARDPSAVPESDSEPFQYESIRIVAPENGGAVWATGGGMTVMVEVQPRLQPGHQIQLTLNGNLVPGTPVAASSISVTGLIRGEHILQAAVVDADGRSQIFSQDVIFNVLQASINSPQRR
jgi:hypothetical protein